jgi:acyl carrier protein
MDKGKVTSTFKSMFAYHFDIDEVDISDSTNIVNADLNDTDTCLSLLWNAVDGEFKINTPPTVWKDIKTVGRAIDYIVNKTGA